MTKLKGIKKINKILTKFASRIYGSELKITMDTDFAYYYTQDTITYSLFSSEKIEKSFRQLFKENGYQYEDDIFLLSFLHEIGHAMTNDDIEDDSDLFSREVKALIGTRDTIADELTWTYYHLPDEIEATRWAIHYLNNHRQQVEELWAELLPAFQKFYKRNEVENT